MEHTREKTLMSATLQFEQGIEARGVSHIAQAATERLDEYLDITRNAGEDRILRDKQMDVMGDLREFIATHPDDLHGYISLPTGVGKTVLFTELVKATGLRTLVLTPTRLLLGQTESAFSQFGDDEVSIGKVYSGEKNSAEQITLTTYASFVRHTKDHNSPHIRPGQYDLIILDEAHRALATQTRKALASYKDTIQIGFTATEDYSERRKLKGLLPTEIHKMTIREAVEHELISPFTNVLVETGVDVSDVRITTSNEYDSADLEKALNTEFRNQIAVDLYLKYFNGMKALAFCNGVAHAKAVAELFAETGVKALAVHGGMTMKELTAAKEAFLRNGDHGLDLLSNDKILIEGFDAPEASVSFNLAPTLSRVRAQQRSGRVLRLDPNDHKKHAYVVDFIDESYRKTPVLFSDPKVAEMAEVGDQSNSIFASQTIKFSTENARLITDPAEVTEKAHEFYESHKVERLLPPDDWLSIAQIATIYRLEKTLVRNCLDALAEKSPELFGEFHNPRTNGRTKRYYFHPDVVRDFAASRELPYVDFEQVMPRGWVKQDEFEQAYPPRVIKSAHQYARIMHLGIQSDHAVTHRGVEYYGPGLQKVLRQGTQPNGLWLSVEPVLDGYSVDEAKVEEMCRVIAKRETLLDGARPAWWLVDNREEMHLSPLAYGHLVKDLEDMRAASEGELEDGAVVNLRPQKANVDLLIRAFAYSNGKKANTTRLTPPPPTAAAIGRVATKADTEELYEAFGN